MAEESRNEYKNDEFKEEFVQAASEGVAAKAKLSYRFWSVVAASLALIMVVVTSLVVFLPKQDNEDHFFSDGGVILHASTYEELYSATGVALSQNFDWHFRRVDLKETGTILTYNADATIDGIEDEDLGIGYLVELGIDIVVEKWYEENLSSTYTEETTVNGYKMQYYKEVKVYEEDNFHENRIRARMPIGNVTVFVTYEEYRIGDELLFQQIMDEVFGLN